MKYTTPSRLCLGFVVCLFLSQCAFSQRLVSNYKQTVNQAPTSLALVSSAPNVAAGSPFSLTATASSALGGTPTGDVTFTATDSKGNVATATFPTTQGAAAWTPSLVAGVYTIVASYAGDMDYLGSTSAPLTETVVVPDFSVAATTQSGSILQGSTFSSGITITPLNHFAGDVTLTCSGAPATTQCAISPTTVHISSTSAASTTATAAQSATLTFATTPTTVKTVARLGTLSIFAFAAVLPFQRRRVRARMVATLLALALLAMLVGCGVPVKYEQTDGTPKGTYTIQITATSGSIVHSTTATVTVR